MRPDRTRPGHRAMRERGQRGFTLIEVVVSTGVLMVVMLFAMQMLGETGRMYSAAQVTLAEPSLDITERWLRRDAQGASQLAIVSHEPITEPLEFWGNVEGLIRYEKVGTNLDRVVLGMEGEELGRRTLMPGILRWKWRAIHQGLVEVEFVFERRVARQPAHAGGGQPTETELERVKRRFALRSQPRSNW